MRKRNGFSIIEAMIALTVISILVASSAHFLSKKSTNVAVAGVDASHGRFECWRGKDGKVRQALYVGDKLVGKIEEVDECKFDPPTDAVKLNVLAVGAGGAGGGLKNDFIDSYKEFNEKGTLDIRKGTVFPKDKNPKKITTKLGSTTQSADYENSQDWFSWDILNRSKNSKAFDAVSAACGTGGGDGGSLTINDKNMDCWDDCYKSIFSTSSSANCSDWGTMNCPYKVITQYEGEAIDSSTDCCSDKLRCVIGEETTETGKLYTCTWDEISYQADLNCPKNANVATHIAILHTTVVLTEAIGLIQLGA